MKFMSVTLFSISILLLAAPAQAQQGGGAGRGTGARDLCAEHIHGFARTIRDQAREKCRTIPRGTPAAQWPVWKAKFNF